MSEGAEKTGVVPETHSAGLLDVLEPLLKYAVQHAALDAFDIFSLKCVSKAANRLIQWEDLKYTTDKVKLNKTSWEHQQFECEQCGRTNGPIHMPKTGLSTLCMHCQGIILTHSAFCTYKLQTHDINHLPCVLACSASQARPYGFWRAAVDHRSVVSIALLKHGGPKGLRRAMLPEQVSQRGLEDTQTLIQKLGFSKEQKVRLFSQPLPRPLLRLMKTGQPQDLKRATRLALTISQYERQLEGLNPQDRAIMLRADFRHAYIQCGPRMRRPWMTEKTVDDVEELLAGIALNGGEQTVVSGNCYARRHIEGKSQWATQALKLLGIAQAKMDSHCDSLQRLVGPIDGNALDFLLKKIDSVHSRGLYFQVSVSESLNVIKHALKPPSGKAERRRQLAETLSKHGLPLRGDSRLSRAFIEGRSNLSLEEVCGMMVEMAWLVEHTNYQQEFSELMGRFQGKKSDEDYNDVTLLAKRSALRTWQCRRSEIPAHLCARLSRYVQFF